MSTMSDEDLHWAFRDDRFYDFLKQKYKERAKLFNEAEDKRKALEKMKDGDPLYHRASVAAEMSSLRVDMAYIVARNTQLEEMLGTVEYLHQKIAILEGAYGHLKLLQETSTMQVAIRQHKEAAK